MSDLRILPHAESDLAIPATADIRTRCHELRADSLQQHDSATARQLELLIEALDSGIKMAWVLGDLLVSSASAPGRVYTVSCGRCNCPARKPCKHAKLADVLLEMLDTAAVDSDFEADCDEAAPAPWIVGGFIRQRLQEAA